LRKRKNKNFLKMKNFPELNEFIQFYNMQTCFFEYVPNKINPIQNKERFEVLQQIVEIYKNRLVMKYSVPIGNTNLKRYGPDSLIINENLEILKTIQFKFRVEFNVYSENTL
jgi:hypothetical protein